MFWYLFNSTPPTLVIIIYHIRTFIIYNNKFSSFLHFTVVYSYYTLLENKFSSDHGAWKLDFHIYNFPEICYFPKRWWMRCSSEKCYVAIVYAGEMVAVLRQFVAHQMCQPRAWYVCYVFQLILDGLLLDVYVRSSYRITDLCCKMMVGL